MSESPPPPIIEMNEVTVAAMRDTSLTVLEAVNWTVAAGEFWVVGGQQHSGKSDLLMLAAGLMSPASGVCRLFGSETRSAGDAQLENRLNVGFVFQNGNLFNRLTIGENVALPLRYQKDLPAPEAAQAIAPLLEITGLAPFADLTPSNVAAVWRHRAALARALVLQPQLLLLDNPLSGVRGHYRAWLVQFLDQLWRGHELTGGRPLTVVVTTDDLLPWRQVRRKFALLHEKLFAPLGHWTQLEQSNHPTLKDLMAEVFETQQ